MRGVGGRRVRDEFRAPRADGTVAGTAFSRREALLVPSHYTAGRKRQLLAAVASGVVSFDDVARAHRIHPEEWATWLVDRRGSHTLKLDFAWTEPDADTRLLFVGGSPNVIARGDRRPSGRWTYRELLPSMNMHIHVRPGDRTDEAEALITDHAQAWFRAIWA